MACSLQFKIGALNLSRQSMLGQIGYDSTHTQTHTHAHRDTLPVSQNLFRMYYWQTQTHSFLKCDALSTLNVYPVYSLAVTVFVQKIPFL